MRRYLIPTFLTLLILILSIYLTLTVVASKEQVSPTPTTTASLAMCGPYALSLAGQRLGVDINEEEIARLAGTDEEGTTMYRLSQAAREKGLKAVGMKLRLEDLKKIKSPVIAYTNYKNKGHYVVIEKIEGDTITVTDSQGDRKLSREEFERRWQGEVLIVTRG